MSMAELDYVQQLLERGKSPIEIHHSLCRLRGRRRVQPPHFTNLRKVLKGITYKRSAVETRGRKSKLSRRMVLRMDDTRKRLLKKRCGTTEVRWTDVIKATRVPEVHRTTAKKALLRENIAAFGRQLLEAVRGAFLAMCRVREAGIYSGIFGTGPPGSYGPTMAQLWPNLWPNYGPTMFYSIIRTSAFAERKMIEILFIRPHDRETTAKHSWAIVGP